VYHFSNSHFGCFLRFSYTEMAICCPNHSSTVVSCMTITFQPIRGMPFIGSVEGKMSFGRANTTTSFVTSNMLLYLDAGNPASYPGSGTTWTNLASGSVYNATSLTGTSYSAANGGYISFNGAGSGSLNSAIYNTAYTGKTVFVAGNLTAITGGTYRAFLGSSIGSRNFNFYMYSPSSGVYQLHFSTGGGGALSTNLSYTVNS
jgi:hypothetical protein